MSLYVLGIYYMQHNFTYKDILINFFNNSPSGFFLLTHRNYEDPVPV